MKAVELFGEDEFERAEAVLAPFRSQIVDRETVRAGLALARQKRIAEANHRLERCFIDGLGQVKASLDADIYHRLAAIYGYQTVNSDDFLKKLLRDNPEIRVQSRSLKVGIYLPVHYQDRSSRPTGNTARVTPPRDPLAPFVDTSPA